MIIRRIGGCSLRLHLRRPPMRNLSQTRKLSTSSSSSLSQPPSAVSPLGSLTTELDRIAPRFEVQASQIEILEGPSSFYETLKNKIRSAKRRIYLSTLYIGKTEHEFIATIQEALRNNPELKLLILTDALRGTRETPEPSCASLLAPLVAEFGSERVDIRMFHTPNLTGLRKRFIPKRINEGWGLQHIKLYGVDDEVIMSGANLSNDYFTNRLDRYHVFSSRKVTEYFAQIHDAVCSLSYQVLPDPYDHSEYLLDWPSSNGISSPLDNPKRFIAHATTLLDPLIQPSTSTSTSLAPTSPSKTYIYPLAQLTPILRPDTSTEYPSITTILSLLSTSRALQSSHWLFTAGYFNIHPRLSSLLIASTSQVSPTKTPLGTVLTASPWANGFYGSAGVSGLLPAAYTLLSRRFLTSVAASNKSSSIQLKEWRRGTVGTPGGWTYHAKGLWITLPNETHPSITLVGSSNYTKRSYSLDLEVGAMIVTGDKGLKKRLGEETEWLQRDAEVRTLDDLRKVERRVGWRVRVAMWIVEMVGGAL